MRVEGARRTTRSSGPGACPRDLEGGDAMFSGPFVLLLAGNAAFAMCSTMTLTLVPLLILQQGLSIAVAGLTTSLYMLAAVLLRPVGGRLVDVHGRHVVVVVGSTLYCAATGLYLLAPPVWLLLAARALQGVGFSLNGTAAATLATDLIPERRMSEGLGYLGLEATLAQVTGPLLALTAAQSFGFRAAFLLALAFGATNLLLRLPLRRRLRPRTRAPAPAAVPLWQRIVEPRARRPATLMFFVMFGNGAVNTFLVAYALQRALPHVGLFFAFSGAFVALARLVVGRLERRVGSSLLITCGLGAITLALVAIAWSPDLPVLLAAGAFFGTGMGTVQPMLNTLVVLAAPVERRGLANSTLFLAMDLSQVVSGVVLGGIAGAAGLASLFLSAAGVTTVTLAVHLGSTRRATHSPRTAPGAA